MTSERAPLAGESLDGYLAFRAERLGLPNMLEVAELAGVTGRGRVRISRSDAPLADVANLLEVDPESLEMLGHPRATGARRRLYMGLSIQVIHLERTRRLFAPAALATSPHHRALWDLLPFPFDEVTWELLRHRCPDPTCERTQGWHHTRGIGICDECGSRLDGELGPTVPPDRRGPLGAALGLVHPDPARRAATGVLLPPALRDLDRGVLLDLLVALAGVVAPRLRAPHNPWCLRPGADPMHVVDAIAAAWPLFVGWPEAFESFALDRAVVTSRGRGDGNSGATNRFLRTAGSVSAPTGLARLVEAECRRLETVGATDGIGASETATRRGLRAQDIARVRREGGIGVVAAMRRGLFLPLLVRSEVEDMSRRFEGTLPLLRAAARLGCGRLGIEQLSAMRLLGPSPPVLPMTGREPRVWSAGISDLIDRLEVRSVRLFADEIALAEALRSCGGRPKPIGPLVLAILRGELKAHIRYGDGPILGRIMVAREDASMIRAMTFDASRHPEHPFVNVVSKGEAGSELNLRPVQWVDLLSRWPADGNLPVVPVRWLVETMSAGISVVEIATLLGRGGRSVAGRLRRLQPRMVMPFLYDRREIETCWSEISD